MEFRKQLLHGDNKLFDNTTWRSKEKVSHGIQISVALLQHGKPAPNEQVAISQTELTGNHKPFLQSISESCCSIEPASRLVKMHARVMRILTPVKRFLNVQ